MKYFVCMKDDSVNVVCLPPRCSSVNCCNYVTFQKRGEMRMEIFAHHTIGSNHPQGLSDGKKIIFCMQNFEYVHIGLRFGATDKD